MKKVFNDLHTSCENELKGIVGSVPDSPEVLAARACAHGYHGFLALGKALSAQLRYCEAAKAFSLALETQPGDLTALRLRAGRYLSSLQLKNAFLDLSKCLELGGDALDIRYRLGLCCYYMGRYAEAMWYFEAAFALADDEMGIAVLYWHILSAYRSGTKSSLASEYCAGMNVGHHFAYKKAVSVLAEAVSAEAALNELRQEDEDPHFGIAAYGISYYLSSVGKTEPAALLMEEHLARDSFWPCYAYLAAWNDTYGKGVFDV